ncbi:MAG: hypothetical protein WB802_08245, partial [Candidatus Dormiibacterota bacterium]
MHLQTSRLTCEPRASAATAAPAPATATWVPATLPAPASSNSTRVTAAGAGGMDDVEPTSQPAGAVRHRVGRARPASPAGSAGPRAA